jgi:ketosteroid isomerase-like protein
VTGNPAPLVHHRHHGGGPEPREDGFMATPLTDDFMRSLQEIERTGRVDPLVDLFHEEAEAMNLGRTEPARGAEQIREFWRAYLSAFKEIHSEFTNVIEGEGGAVLEWVSRGALPNGEPVEYRGVSVLETDGGKVRKFRTYYDSAVFLPEGAKSRA